MPLNSDNGIKKANKWLYFIMGICALIGILIGYAGNAAIKNAKIEENCIRSIKNEELLHEMKEEQIKFMSEIRTDLKYIVKELDKRK